MVLNYIFIFSIIGSLILGWLENRAIPGTRWYSISFLIAVMYWLVSMRLFFRPPVDEGLPVAVAFGLVVLLVAFATGFLKNPRIWNFVSIGLFVSIPLIVLWIVGGFTGYGEIDFGFTVLIFLMEVLAIPLFVLFYFCSRNARNASS